MTRTAVALGSNLGDRLGHLRSAVSALAALGVIETVSSLYETDPVGGPEQDDYLNAVVVLDTRLEPLDLLSQLQEIEAAAHRVRAERWGPRTLDLDIVAWDREPLVTPRLHVPHPRAAERRFVLEPLVEVWPEAPVAPDLHATAALAVLRGQRVRRWHGAWVDEMPHLGPSARWWVTGQVALLTLWGVVLIGTARLPVPPVRGIGGGAVSLAGLGLGAAALVALGRELTPYPQPRAGATLVTRGAYRRARHPIYGSIVLLLAGVSAVFGSVTGVAGALAVAVFFRAKAAVEERALAIGVPGYPDYRRRVRRRFVPFLW